MNPIHEYSSSSQVKCSKMCCGWTAMEIQIGSMVLMLMEIQSQIVWHNQIEEQLCKFHITITFCNYGHNFVLCPLREFMQPLETPIYYGYILFSLFSLLHLWTYDFLFICISMHLRWFELTKYIWKDNLAVPLDWADVHMCMLPFCT